MSDNDERKYVTISYIPSKRPLLHARIEAMPERGRSAEICNELDPAVTPVHEDDRLDRMLELVEKIALQADRLDSAFSGLAVKLAAGTPMQTVIEEMDGEDLPDDVIDNLLEID